MKTLKVKTKLFIMVLIALASTLIVTLVAYIGMSKLNEASITTLEEKVRVANATKLLEFADTDIQESFDTFMKIAESYDTDANYMSDLVSSIKDKSFELNETINSVAESMDGINNATEESATGITDIATQGSEMTVSSASVLDQASTTSKIAVELRKSIEFFKFN